MPRGFFKKKKPPKNVAKKSWTSSIKRNSINSISQNCLQRNSVSSNRNFPSSNLNENAQSTRSCRPRTVNLDVTYSDESDVQELDPDIEERLKELEKNKSVQQEIRSKNKDKMAWPSYQEIDEPNSGSETDDSEVKLDLEDSYVKPRKPLNSRKKILNSKQTSTSDKEIIDFDDYSTEGKSNSVNTVKRPKSVSRKRPKSVSRKRPKSVSTKPKSGNRNDSDDSSFNRTTSKPADKFQKIATDTDTSSTDFEITSQAKRSLNVGRMNQIEPSSPLSDTDISDADDPYSINVQAQTKKIYKDTLSALSRKEMQSNDIPDLATPLKFENSLNDSSLIRTSSRRSSKRITRQMSDDSPKLDFELDMSHENSCLKSSKPVQKRRKKTVSKAVGALDVYKRTCQNGKRADDSPVQFLESRTGENSFLVLSDSSDNDSIEFYINVEGRLIPYTIQKDETFLKIYRQIADEKGLSISNVLLTFNDEIVLQSQNSSHILLNQADVLDFAAIETGNSKFSTDLTHNASQLSLDSDKISIKIQTANRKIVHTLLISKYDRMCVMMSQYAQLREIPQKNLRFKFDGEFIRDNDTATTLELEGDECIDVFEV